MTTNRTTPTTPTAKRERHGALCDNPRCVETTARAGGKVYNVNGRPAVQHGRGKNRDRARRKVRIIEREGGRCAWCGCEVAPETCEADRVAEGGRYVLHNVVAACRPCNRERRDMPADQWAKVCADPDRAAYVLSYVPGGCY